MGPNIKNIQKIILLLCFFALIIFGNVYAKTVQPLAEKEAVSTDNVVDKALPVKKQEDNLGHKHKEEAGIFNVDFPILFSQTLNFLILLFVVKKLLYERVANVLKEREQEIGKLRLKAEEDRNEAAKLKEKYKKLIENIEEKAYEIKQQAIKEAKADTQEIIEEAKKKAEQIVEKGEIDLFMERQAAWMQIREQLVELTELAAEKVLEDSLDDEMHRKIIERSIAKIERDLPNHRVE